MQNGERRSAKAIFSAPGREDWKSSEPHWGVWSIPESNASILPENIKGLNTLELACFDILLHLYIDNEFVFHSANYP